MGKEAASLSRMSLEEAHKILGVERNASLEEVVKASLVYSDVRQCQ